MTHFYLTLPSNSSSNYYPDNTLTRFITKLPSSVSLSGDWEVALSEIHFPRTWYTVKKGGETITVECVVPESDIVYPSPGRTRLALFPPGGEAKVIDIQMIDVKLQGGYYETMQDIVKEMNTVMVREFTDKLPKETTAPKIRFSELNKRTYYTLPKGVVMLFPIDLRNMLGLADDQMEIGGFEGEMKILKSQHVSDINGGLHSMYIYCDLLEHVAVGDTSAPLLRVVDARGKNGDMQHRIYEPPRYMPVQKKNFDCLEIDIRDDLGRPIPFESGKLTVTLHFRRAKNPYFL